jgi:hypothetical protein
MSVISSDISVAEVAEIAEIVEVAEVAETSALEALLASVKSLEIAELFKLLKVVISETEKKAKAAAKAAKSPKTEKPAKKGSMPKGEVPKQLKKPRAWVEFVMKHAIENGWDTFTVHQTKKDKETGEKIEEEITMPCSVLHEGSHVFDGSVTEKSPKGKQLIHKDAMSLSKFYWAPKAKTGTRPELYEEFEASYVEPADDSSSVSSSSASSTSTASKVVRKTAEEKEAEREAKKAAREAEKEKKRLEKAAQKEKEKLEKAANKKSGVPAAAIKKAKKEEPKNEEPKNEEPKKAVKKAVKKPAAPAPKVDTWSCPNDGGCHLWTYNGVQYFRTYDNEVWIRADDGGCGAWQGIYLPAEDRIDTSAPEPEFADEE